MTDGPTETAPDRLPVRAVAKRWLNRVWFATALIYAAFWLSSDFRWWRPERSFNAADNQNIAEARSWLVGRLDLIVDAVSYPDPNSTGRPWDTALVGRRVFNHLPPLATLLFLPSLAAFDGTVPHALLLVLVVLVVPWLALRLFRTCVNDLWPAVLITLAFLIGTSLAPVAYRAATTGKSYFVNHLLATSGLLILLTEYFGRRRVWLAGLGLIAAFWSRQMTFFYVLPFLWMAGRAGSPREAATEWPLSRRGRLVLAGSMLTVMVGFVLLLNGLKFGHPLDTGYARIYAGRDDDFARDAKTGVFSWHHVPGNVYSMHLGLPRLVQAGGLYLRHERDTGWSAGYDPSLREAGWFSHRVNLEATGIWWTTPLLLYLLVDARRIWRDRDRRVLLLASALVSLALLFYLGNGRVQSGYNRFSLDFLAPALAIIAPFMFDGRRRWITVGLIAWSLFYFQWLIPQQSAW